MRHQSKTLTGFQILLIIVGAVLAALTIAIGTIHYNKYLSPGWHDGGTYHMEKFLKRSTGLCKIGGEYYLFDNSGKLLYGWNFIGNTGYYSDRDGLILRGERTVDGKTYNFSETDGHITVGIAYENGVGRCYDECGYPVAGGLVSVDGSNYYFDENGEMQTGMMMLNGSLYYFGDDGKAASGFTSIDGKTYYFSESEGAAVCGTATIEGSHYRFGSDGVMVTGWYEEDGAKFYYYSDGKAASGDTVIDGISYKFASNGMLGSGWLDLDSGRLYILPDGEYATGNVEIDGIIYSFDESGLLMTGWKDTENGKKYYGSDGIMRLGWVDISENRRYYFGDDGILRTGVCTVDGNELYFGDDGVFTSGWINENDNSYYYYENGKMAAGLCAVGESTYCFDSSTGALYKSGWCTIDGLRCYADAEGKALDGEQTINGTKYYFTNHALIAEGWATIDGVRMYFDKDSRPLTGEQIIDGAKYRFMEDGRLLTGWYTDSENRTYYLGENGYPLTGWQTISKKLYYFKLDGTMLTDTYLGLYSIGKDGVAVWITPTRDNFDYYISELVKAYASTPETIFQYIRSNYKYKKTDKSGDSIDDALHILNYRKGACYHFAALSYHMLKAAGYETIIIHGDGLYNAPEHYWTMVKINGKWYHYDALQNQYMKTDKELIAAGYNWNFSDFPSAA